MIKEKVTLEDAAQLEGIGYEAMKKKIQRYPDQYKTTLEPSLNGGKDRVLVEVSCLSPKAQKAYKARRKLDTIDDAISKDTDDNTPWYIDADFNWYMENYKKHYYEAVELSKKVINYLEQSADISHNEKKSFIEQYAKAHTDMSWRNFYRKVEAYLEATAWAIKKAAETDKNHDYYKVLALSREPREKGQISLTEEMKATLQNIKFDPIVIQNRWKVKKIFRLFEEKAAEKGWETIPSYQTVNRYINELVKQNASAAFLAEKDKKEWQRFFMEKKIRDLAALEVLEFAMGDGHTFDCWVKITRKNGELDYIRPHLLAWIDIRSRSLLSWVICEVPNSQIVKKSIVNMIYPKKDSRLPYGVPKYLYIDNGKEFTAQCLTGRPRTERISLDSDVKGFFRGVGIEDDIRALPYMSSSKAEIERLFGTVCEDFSKESNTYTGTLTGKSTDAKIKRNIKKMGEKGQVESIEAFSNRFHEWVIKYHARKHEGLQFQGEAVPKPIEVFNTASKYKKPAPTRDFTETLLMKSVKRVVRQEGIKMFGKIFYTHEDLRPYRRQWVTVRYDPDDVSEIRVYSEKGKKICVATSYELLKISPKSNEKALIEHLKGQKHEYREMDEKIKYFRTTYEERVDLSEGQKIITPENKDGNPKVVSLPDDKQYRDDLKEKKNNTESEVPDFFAKQAEKFMARLKTV